MKIMKIIGLVGPGPGCGKTTFAQMLVGERFVRAPFAAPLKAMTEAALGAAGYTGLEIHRLLTSDKEALIPQFGVTLRFFMQRLGTEFGRQQINEDLWVNLWKARCERHIADGCRGIVCDDVRFANEARALGEAGGILVWVKQPGYQAPPVTHASEGGIAATDCDHHAIGLSLGETLAFAKELAGSD